MRARFCLAAALALFGLAGATGAIAAEGKPLIYAVFWNGCELSCQSFTSTIEESGLDAALELRNAEQDKSRFPGFVAEARGLGADLVLTFGTNVTLGMAGTLDDVGDPQFITDIPLVFMQVADPFGTRIAESFERSGRDNVTGTFNRVPETVNIEVIRTYDPGFRRLGILYNANERNSVLKVEEMRALSGAMGFELVAMQVDPANTALAPDPSLIAERMAEIAEEGIDFMYLGSSSFLRLNGAVYTEAAVANGIPVLSPYENLVREERALLSIAAREADIGRVAAGLALAILRDGAVPGDLPIAQVTDFAYVVNMDVARALGRYPPFEFMQIAEVVQ